MAAPILPVSGVALPDAIRPAGQPRLRRRLPGRARRAPFRQVESFGQNASASVERFLSGENEELHTTILATQQAELSFELFLQARNKVVSAYQEIMRMQM